MPASTSSATYAADARLGEERRGPQALGHRGRRSSARPVVEVLRDPRPVGVGQRAEPAYAEARAAARPARRRRRGSGSATAGRSAGRPSRTAPRPCAWIGGGRKCTCTSNSPGRPRRPPAGETSASASEARANVYSHALERGGRAPARPRGWPAARRARAACRRSSCPGERDLDLGAAVLEVQRQRHDRSPRSLTLRSILSISCAVEQQLALAPRRWLVQVPWVYSGMCTPCSQASPSSISANPSTSEARPARSDFTSVPIEHQAGLEGVVDVVVVPRLAVLRDQLAPDSLTMPAESLRWTASGSGPAGLEPAHRVAARRCRSTVKCRWQPVDQPVVPTYPIIWPRSTCWPVPTL